MTLSPSERARAVVRYLAKSAGTTQAQIGQRLGYTNKSAFSSVLNGLKPLPVRFGEKLAALDPSINPAFLAGDSEEMLLPGHDQPALPPVPDGHAASRRAAGIFVPAELVQMFTDLSATIRSQQETIRALTAGKAERGDSAASF